MRMWTSDPLPTLDTLTPIILRDGKTGEKHFANCHSLEEFCDNWELRHSCLCPDTNARVTPNNEYWQRRSNTPFVFYFTLSSALFLLLSKTLKQFLLHSSRNCYVGVSGEHLRLTLLSSVETNCTCVQKYQNDLNSTMKIFIMLWNFNFLKYLFHRITVLYHRKIGILLSRFLNI